MAGLLVDISRRTGVAHIDRWYEAIASLPDRNLRLELFDSNPPRHWCSRCWSVGRWSAGNTCDGEGGRRMKISATSLAQHPNLGRRTRKDFGDPAIAAYESSDADRPQAVPHLRSSKRAAVLDPNHDCEAMRVWVVQADVEERRRSVARRGEAGADYGATDRGHASNGSPRLLPADRAAAGDGARGGGGRLGSRTAADGRNGCNRKQQSREASHVGPVGKPLTILKRGNYGSGLVTPDRGPLLAPQTSRVGARMKTYAPFVATSSTAAGPVRSSRPSYRRDAGARG